MQISENAVSSEAVIKLLQDHLDDMHATSPPESVHALDPATLRKPNITFWVCEEGEHLLGCGALKELNATEGEIKSMRTIAEARGKGVASALLQHILLVAKARGYQHLHLETGSMAFFEPARKLYLKHGFQMTGPFGDYSEDPNSVFMTLALGED